MQIRILSRSLSQALSMTLTVTCIAPLFVLSTAAQAQPSEHSLDHQSNHPSDQTPDALDQIIVTATRTAVTTDAALAPVEVIDRDIILRSQAASLGDLLRGRAGINLVNQGGIGKLTSIFVRGSESDHVLVLVDGVRIGSATSGAAAFQDLPLALIDRIEIVRGPRSSLYGSDAIGGVIQIFTRHDRGPAQLRFDVGIGSHGRREAGAGIGGSNDRGWYGIDAAYLHTDGINACNGSSTLFAGCFTEEPDRDGYNSRAVSVRGGVTLGDNLKLDAQALDVRGENHYDGSFVNRSNTVQRVLGATLQWQASERIALQFGAGSNRDASDNFLDSADGRHTANGNFGSRRDSASAQADFTLTDAQLLTLGADWLRDRIDSDTPYTINARRNVAGFAQYQGRFGAHDLQLALRRDDNDQFGGKTTGTAAWGISFNEAWRISASYGTAFKAPNFDELYFPFFGNPALRPESSHTAGLGLVWRHATTNVHLNMFNTLVKDLIAFDAALFLPNNIATARLRGAELQIESEVFGWDINASASWLEARNRSNDPNRNNDLPRRARNTARIDLDHAFGAFRLGFTGVAESARFDDISNTRRLGGYSTLDLRTEYVFNDMWKLQAAVDNVFARNYETAAFYNQPGRTFSIRLRYAPTR